MKIVRHKYDLLVEESLDEFGRRMIFAELYRRSETWELATSFQDYLINYCVNTKKLRFFDGYIKYYFKNFEEIEELVKIINSKEPWTYITKFNYGRKNNNNKPRTKTKTS